MDKYAILILAHTNMEQLQLLCSSFDSDYFDIFIHIDKKADINNLNLITKKSKVLVLEDRIKINWGGFSIVKAMNRLYETANSFSNYKRFILISGLDYPIKSNDYIYNELKNKKEYIIGRELLKTEYHKVNNTYIFDNKLLNVPFKILNKLKKRNGNTYKHLKLNNGEILNVYFAPQWSILTKEFVNYYLNFIKEHKEVLKFFKHSYAPDELLIPTILFNSKFKNNAIRIITDPTLHYNEYSSTHYLNYEPAIEVFDEKSYDSIINSNKLFVRKVVLPKSKILMDKLNQYRCN